LTEKNKKYTQSEKKENYIQNYNQQAKLIRDRYKIEENKKSEEKKKHRIQILASEKKKNPGPN